MSERRNIIAWLHSPAAYLTVATAGVAASQAPKACEALARALEDGDPEVPICICVSDVGSPDWPRCGPQVRAAYPIHEWVQTGWEYDDSFFQCNHCHLKVHQRRGTPASTRQECLISGIAACTGEKENNCNACQGVRIMPRNAGPHATASDTVPAPHTCGKEESNEVSHVHPRRRGVRT